MASDPTVIAAIVGATTTAVSGILGATVARARDRDNAGLAAQSAITGGFAELSQTLQDTVRMFGTERQQLIAEHVREVAGLEERVRFLEQRVTELTALLLQRRCVDRPCPEPQRKKDNPLLDMTPLREAQ